MNDLSAAGTPLLGPSGRTILGVAPPSSSSYGSLTISDDAVTPNADGIVGWNAATIGAGGA